MSVNPYLLWICGISDAFSLDDKRFDSAIRQQLYDKSDIGWYKETLVPVLTDDDFDLITGQYKNNWHNRPQISDIYYEGSPMSGLCEHDPVAGYIISECHDQTLLRGLSLIGFDDWFREKSYKVIPTHQNPLDIYSSFELKNERVKTEARKAVNENRLIEMYRPWETDAWYKCAIHVLHLVGWTGVTKDMLKLMIIFSWA